MINRWTLLLLFFSVSCSEVTMNASRPDGGATEKKARRIPINAQLSR